MVARLTEDLGVNPDRGAVPGRLVRPRRLPRGAAGARPPRHAAGVDRPLPAQHHRGENRPARSAPGRAPEAVIMIGAYRPVASLITWARHVGMDPTFLTVSFVGSNALAEELGAAGEGVYVTQVVPFPERGRAIPARGGLLPARAGVLRTPEAIARLRVVRRLPGRPPGGGREWPAAARSRSRARASWIRSCGTSAAIDIDGFELRYGGCRQPGLGRGVSDPHRRRRTLPLLPPP